MALDVPQTRHRLGFATVIAVLVLQVGCSRRIQLLHQIRLP